ncbi:MAG TPA: hypothetical protein VFM13_00805 [Gaiellaceae bacterium]|nr:hypothetical protein [Gaiellaceae bacterium]
MGALDGKRAIVTGASSGIGAAEHVNVDELVVKARAQSAPDRIVRGS